MLKLLDYSVEFPTTGRSFQNRIEFAPGLTAITGRNEAGKTLVMEMVRYALFGKDALRGLASDYRNLSVTLNLGIMSHDVLIERLPRKETLTIDGEVTAVGAQAINAAVPALLGYGLDVFDIAQAAVQGDLGALTEMKPTPRRQMVEKLVGIDVLEQIEKDCRAETKTQETLAASLVTSMPVPQEPVAPDDYEPSEKLQQISDEVQAHQAERAQLLRIQEPVAPVAPISPAETDVGMLEAHEANRQVLLQAQARLQGQLAGIPIARHSREELAKALAYQEYEAEVRRRGAKPEYSAEQLQAFQAKWDAIAACDGRESVTCPKCAHSFLPDVSDDVADLAAGAEPPIGTGQITTQFRRIELWAGPLAEVSPFTIDNIQQEILAHARADDRAAIATELAGLEIPADRSGDLRAARAFQQEFAVYRERADRFGREMGLFQAAQARLASLGDRSGELDTLQRRLGEARAYEAALGRYADAKSAYDQLCERAGAARDLADGFTRGGTALRNARTKVKQELAPSLSRAASTLIAAMTNGERRFVDVDHDFNIIVDGQPLQTLSGSGKSVVNLALRIGLGQVLTSKVLPIFMGDEIDKDMDQERATSTHGTMQNLREYLTQIILVTHKEIEADNVIRL